MNISDYFNWQQGDPSAVDQSGYTGWVSNGKTLDYNGSPLQMVASAQADGSMPTFAGYYDHDGVRTAVPITVGADGTMQLGDARDYNPDPGMSLGEHTSFIGGSIKPMAQALSPALLAAGVGALQAAGYIGTGTAGAVAGDGLGVTGSSGGFGVGGGGGGFSPAAWMGEGDTIGLDLSGAGSPWYGAGASTADLNAAVDAAQAGAGLPSEGAIYDQMASPGGLAQTAAGINAIDAAAPITNLNTPFTGMRETTLGDWGKLLGNSLTSGRGLAALAALSALQRGQQGGDSGTRPTNPADASFSSPLSASANAFAGRRPANMAGTDWYTYGTKPGGTNFFQPVQKAHGGLAQAAGASEPHPAPSRAVRGSGGGRDDAIPARLSDGEYVLDAETVSLLGDGSTDEGSRRLDQFREKIRAHKGRALARGRFSPDAKAPEAYIGRSK